MRGRREFISLLGGAVAAWPLTGRGQQGEQVRRIGVLAGGTGGERPEFTGFQQGLNQLGWRDGGNVRIEYRWGLGNAADIRRYAEELVAFAPDVILAAGASALAPLLQVSRRVPIVFVSVVDPA